MRIIYKGCREIEIGGTYTDEHCDKPRQKYQFKRYRELEIETPYTGETLGHN